MAAVLVLSTTSVVTVASGAQAAKANAAPIHAATVTPNPPLPADPTDWLGWLNYYRGVGGVAPVTNNPAWTAGEQHHAQYLVDWAASSESCSPGFPHCEDTANPHYSADGQAAAAASNIERSTDWLGETAAESISALMAAPFHGVGFVDPRLTQSAFGSYLNPNSAGIVKYAGLIDVLRGRNGSFPAHAVGWPANGTVVPLTSYLGNESPDPLVFSSGSDCTGYTAPTGLPILVQFPDGVDPSGATATLTNNGNPVDHCVVTTKDYVGELQGQFLTARNFIFILPKKPLVPGQTYTYTVSNAGSTAVSSSFTVCSPPSPPGEGTATDAGDHSHVTWTVPASNGGLPITGYTVTIEPSGGGPAVSVVHVPAGVLQADVAGLSKGFIYIILLSAQNAAGSSDPYKGQFNTGLLPQGIQKPGAPPPPTGVGGTAQIAVAWKPPAGIGGAPISGYVVTPWLAGVAQTPYVQNGTGTTHTFVGLNPDTAYRFTVAATNSAGTGIASEPSAAISTLPNPVAPGAPTGLTATGGNTQVKLTWTAPGQNGGAAINGYVVTPKLDGVAQTPVTFNSAATTQTLTGLTNGHTYSYTVAARNSVGTGAASAASALMVPPFANATLFVQSVLSDLQGRAGTSSEISQELTRLAGGASPGAIVADIRGFSDATTNVDPVARLYFAYFLRIPDVGGLNYWIGRKRGGTSLYTASDNFAASSEFRTRYGSLTNQQFVNLVYQNVLGRPGDSGGVSYWTGQLDTGAKTRGQVMVGFSESSEYRTLQAPGVATAVCFISLLGVSPSTSEFDSWVSALKATTPMPVATLATAVLADARYAARV